MSKPSKDVLDKFKVKADLVDVIIDGVLVQLPRRVAHLLTGAFSDDNYYQYQKDLWDMVTENPLPKP